MKNTETAVQVYNFKDNSLQTIRIKGEPWFVGKDLTNILEYKNPTKALRDNVDEEDQQTLTYKASNSKLKATLWSGNDYSNKTLVNESGMYSLILRSTMKGAKEFKHWVTSEVLPSIRKHGAYMTPEVIKQTLTNPDFIIGLATELKTEQLARQEAEDKLEQQKPKVDFHDKVAETTNTIPMSEMSNFLKQNGIDIGRNRLFDQLREDGLIQKYSTLPTQRAMNLGIFKVTEHLVKIKGEYQSKYTTRVTGRGQQYLIKKYTK